MKLSLPQQNVYFSFFIYSFSFGGLFPRLGDLQLQMNIGEAALGMALVGLPIGVQISLLFADKILQFIGFRFTMNLGVPTIGISLIFASLSNHPGQFFLSLVLGGLAVGIMEVSVNLEADRVEYRIKRKIMNRSHSFWSLGFFVAGFVGAWLSQIQISPTIHFLLSFLVSSLFTFSFSAHYKPSLIRPNKSIDNPIFVRPTKAILALVIFTLSAMLIEGAGIDWSIIFMRDVFSTPAFLNGTAFVIGAFAQFLVRYFADTFVESHGPLNVARLSIVAMFIGLIIVCSSTNPYFALFGFALMGGGNAVLFPLAISAAAQKTDRPAAVNVASLAQISFLMFLIGPPILGVVAENYSIRLSFGLGLPLLILSWIYVSSLQTESVENSRLGRKS